MDCETFDVLGRWEIDRGPQDKHYDFWWNLPRDYMVSSEWGLPPQFENGIVPEDLLGNKYGHRIHFWDLRARRNVQTIDLGANHQMALEVRPAHDPIKEHGFVGVVVDTTNLEGSIWTWWREGGKFHCEKTAVIPPEQTEKDQLPPLLQGFGAVPPLVTDIDLSLDDRFLYVACWGTGEMRQYDVSDPRAPKLAGSVHIGGIARRTAHPNGKAFGGGPQMVEISRDGKRVYWTNSLYSTWDNQFYPDGVPGAMVKADMAPAVASAWTRISGSSSPTDTGRIRSDLRAATARPTPSAIRPSEGGRDSMDHGRPLVGRGRQRLLSRRQSMHGMASSSFRRLDGSGTAGCRGGHGAACGWAPRGHARHSSALCADDRTAGLAAGNPDRCERRRNRLRRLPPRQPATPARARSDQAHAACALVLRNRDRPRRRFDAAADLSGPLFCRTV